MITYVDNNHMHADFHNSNSCFCLMRVGPRSHQNLRSPMSLTGRIRAVLQYPHPALRVKTSLVSFGGPSGTSIEPHAARVAADLVATAGKEEGLGLAAPQVITLY